MIIGMVLGIPCIECRSESKRPVDLANAIVKIPPIGSVLSRMLADEATARPTAGKVVVTLKDVLKRLG
jgi:hypothetical protein